MGRCRQRPISAIIPLDWESRTEYASPMYAVCVINVEAPLEGTFHYDVPRDLRETLQPGHLVEVQFGNRMAQAIIIRFDHNAPVVETKPVIALVHEEPVVRSWQIELALWMHERYLTPLNACLRLMLPPGLTRWADILVDINPRWDGRGRLTDLQSRIIDLLREKRDLRGRQIRAALPKKMRKQWQTAVNQLVKRDILRKVSILDPPRIRPKKVRSATLTAGKTEIETALLQMGRKNKQADLLATLLRSSDPLPRPETILQTSGAAQSHLEQLIAAGLLRVTPAAELLLPLVPADEVDAALQEIWRALPAVATGVNFSPEQIEALVKAGKLQIVPQPTALQAVHGRAETVAAALDLRGASTYGEIIAYLRRVGGAAVVSDIYAATSANLNHLRKLAAAELLILGEEEIWRDPLADRDFMPSDPPQLTVDQARVWGRVKMALFDLAAAREEGAQAMQSAILLHGVTGSGKTEIYMRAIDFALEEGRQAIVLVPEIALTTQTVRRFAARFPGRVAVLHSRLSDGERYDTWRRAQAGLFDIVVGPRSALFLPLADVGVIVLDEEHDPSYKQTPPVPPPYYHARETAVALGRRNNALVIMGSATPDIVTYHRARGGRYQLLELPKRIMGHRQRILSQADRLQIPAERLSAAAGSEDPDDALTIPLPPIQVVDLRQELRAGNRSIFSRALEKALTDTLARGEQAILFLNRRGSATFVICRDCGYVAKCPRCDSPLTHHQRSMQLRCHQCGYQQPYLTTCPECDSKRIKYFGLGTESLAEQVKKKWPEARLTRWDRDTTAGRHTHDELLAGFINQEADILIGTQMIAKGLDLPLVTLVGVISADVALGLPDYRTGERAFQLLAQVAGRAGRGLLGGRVIIQTYKPEHYAIQAAAEHDFAAFYIDEIRFRTQHNLPPFRRMARLLFVDPVNERGKREAERTAAALRRHVRQERLGATEVLGPVPPFFARVDGRYRWQILLRTPDPVRLLTDFPLGRGWMVDIDPVSTL